VILKVASVEVPLFVTFHFINAYEEEDEDGRVTAVIADCCEHNSNTDILEKLKLQNLRSFNGKDVLPDAKYVFDILIMLYPFLQGHN
jgi:carlactone synthase/all-trans-10'-apo-beta-carotenal 13,14-cleaving dioxygenase